MLKRATLGNWLFPTLVGPPLAAALLITLFIVTKSEPPFGGKLLNWAVLLPICVIIASLEGVLATLIDGLLLLVRLRMPPTGRRAWLSGCLIPLPTYLLWAQVRPPWLAGWAPHAWAVAGAMLACVVAVRLLLSERPGGTRFS